MIRSCEAAFHRTSFLSTLLVMTFFLLLFFPFRHHVFNDVRSRDLVLFCFAMASEGERQAKTFLLRLKSCLDCQEGSRSTLAVSYQLWVL